MLAKESVCGRVYPRLNSCLIQDFQLSFDTIYVEHEKSLLNMVFLCTRNTGKGWRETFSTDRHDRQVE